MYSKKQLYMFRRHFYSETNIRPFIRATKRDEVLLFNTIYDCAAHFQLPTDEVWKHFIFDIPLNGFYLTHIRFYDKEALAPKILPFVTRELEEGQSSRSCREVKLLDIKTNSITHFPSLSHAARFLHVEMTHVRNRISAEGKVRLMHNRYIITDKKLDIGFITKEVKDELIKKIPRQLLVLNTHTGELERYLGVTSFTRETKCEYRYSQIVYALKTKGIYQLGIDLYAMYDPNRLAQTEDKIIRQRFKEAIRKL